jgi:SAM-dependent methyltransferase
VSSENVEVIRYLKRRVLTVFYRAYLWSVATDPTEFFQVSERIIEYPFAIQSIASLPKGSRVAILGCHGDLLTTILPTLGYEVDGIDVKPFPLGIGNFHFHQEDIRNTSFASSFFDAVIAISTLEHIGLFDGDEDGDKKTVAEIRRILRPRGICVITVPFAKNQIKIPLKQRIYDASSLKDLLTGLSVSRMSVNALNNRGIWEPTSLERVPLAKSFVECVAMIEAMNLGSDAERRS